MDKSSCIRSKMQPRFLVITSLDSKLIKPKKSLPNINLNAWLNKVQTCLKMQSKMGLGCLNGPMVPKWA